MNAHFKESRDRSRRNLLMYHPVLYLPVDRPELLEQIDRVTLEQGNPVHQTGSGSNSQPLGYFHHNQDIVGLGELFS